MTLHLADAINKVFGGGSSESDVSRSTEKLQAWYHVLPDQQRPLCQSANFGTFPSIWMLGDSHVATMQYYLIATSVLRSAELPDNSVDDQMEENAVRVCGLAFTSGNSAVIINSFGPMTYCGRHIRSKALQSDLVRRLHGCRKDSGWPVQRTIDDLERVWNAETS